MKCSENMFVGVCHCVQLSKVHAHTVCSTHNEISHALGQKNSLYSIMQPLLDLGHSVVIDFFRELLKSSL